MEHVTILVSTYGILILLPLMIIEGPIVTIIASFLASLGVVSILYIYFLALLGNILGDLNYYSIGRFGRKTFIKKYGKYIGLNEEVIESIENHYKNHFFKTIFIAKITEAPIIPTLVAAGLARVNIKKFIALITAIEIPKVFIVVLIGYYFGKFYVTIGSYVKSSIIAIWLTLGLFLMLFILYKKLKIKK